MVNNIPDSFFKDNPIQPSGSAMLAYYMYTNEGLLERLKEEKEQRIHSGKDQEELEKTVVALDETKEILRFMRKSMDGCNKLLLRDVVLAHEADVTDLIKKRIMTSRLDDFIDNTLDFFLRCEADPVPWLKENIPEMKSPYARSVMCVVLGFRGGEDELPFLFEQFDKLKNEPDEEAFEQGPLLSIFKICGKEI